jgi:hypothetical protein
MLQHYRITPTVHFMYDLQICTPIKVTYMQEQEKNIVSMKKKNCHQSAGNKADKKDRKRKMKIPTVLQIRL